MTSSFVQSFGRTSLAWPAAADHQITMTCDTISNQGNDLDLALIKLNRTAIMASAPFLTHCLLLSFALLTPLQVGVPGAGAGQAGGLTRRGGRRRT